VGVHSVALVDEAAHARARRVLNVPLHGQKMRRHGLTIVEAARAAVRRFRPGEVRPMLPAMQDVSLEVILRVIFGVTDEREIPVAARAVMRMVLAYTPPLLVIPALRHDLGGWSPGGRFARARQAVDDWIFGEIARRRDRPDPERVDVLSLL